MGADCQAMAQEPLQGFWSAKPLPSQLCSPLQRAMGESAHILTLQHTMTSQTIQADDQLKAGPKLELASALEGAHKAQRKAIINVNRV